MAQSTVDSQGPSKSNISGPVSSPVGGPSADAYTALYNSNNFLKDRYNRLNKDHMTILKNIKKLTPELQKLILADTSVASSKNRSTGVPSKSESDASKTSKIASHTSGSMSSQGAAAAVADIYPSLATDKNSGGRQEVWTMNLGKDGAAQVRIKKESSPPCATDITDACLLADLRTLVQESVTQGRALQRVQEQLRAQTTLLKSFDENTNKTTGHNNPARPFTEDTRGVYVDRSDEWTMIQTST